MKILFLAGMLVVVFPAHAQQKADDPLVKRGRYLVQIGGCNDCHTPDYPAQGGKVPEAQWLTGDALGWQGGWGTTYATNLRLYMQDLTEEQWIKKAKALNARPPMPWFNVRAMSNTDLRAFYRYVRHLGPAGTPSRPAEAPGARPATAVIQWPAPKP